MNQTVQISEQTSISTYNTSEHHIQIEVLYFENDINRSNSKFCKTFEEFKQFVENNFEIDVVEDKESFVDISKKVLWSCNDLNQEVVTLKFYITDGQDSEIVMISDITKQDKKHLIRIDNFTVFNGIEFYSVVDYD